MPTSTQLDTRVLDAIIKNLPGNVADNIKKAAFAIEGRAKVNIQTMEAIDTGALLNSVAVSLREGGDVSEAQAAARGRNAEAAIVDLPVPRESSVAFVGPTVEYGADVHYGTTTMAGRPFLLEAVRQTEEEFRKLMGKVVTNGR